MRRVGRQCHNAWSSQRPGRLLVPDRGPQGELTKGRPTCR